MCSTLGEKASAIKYLETSVIYENAQPQVHSRHGFFPGVVELPSGDVLALFVRSEAFESPDATTFVSRSKDSGKTWVLEGPLYDKSVVGFETSDSMKPTVLRDGTLVAVGYRFYRRNPEQGIGIEETNGILPGDDLVSFSNDEGRTWSVPQPIPRTHPELLEISGPCIELRSGDLVAVAGVYKMPDGTTPSGQRGVLLRSSDMGRSWDDTLNYFETPGSKVAAWEPRICEMQAGRLVAILWAYDTAAEKHLTNRVVVSHDNGRSWSTPIDTGIMGQASNLLWLGEDQLMTIHAHRQGEVGLYVRLINFKNDQWKVIEECRLPISTGEQASNRNRDMVSMFRSLRFGQPSLILLRGDVILATHWLIEEGQGKIVSHRLKLR